MDTGVHHFFHNVVGFHVRFQLFRISHILTNGHVFESYKFKKFLKKFTLKIVEKIQTCESLVGIFLSFFRLVHFFSLISLYVQ